MKTPDKNAVILTKEQNTYAAEQLREFISENFEIELSNMQSGFLVDFISENIGRFYYNNAVADSIKFMSEKTDDLYLLMKEE